MGALRVRQSQPRPTEHAGMHAKHNSRWPSCMCAEACPYAHSLCRPLLSRCRSNPGGTSGRGARPPKAAHPAAGTPPGPPGPRPRCTPRPRPSPNTPRPGPPRRQHWGMPAGTRTTPGARAGTHSREPETGSAGLEPGLGLDLVALLHDEGRTGEKCQQRDMPRGAPQTQRSSPPRSNSLASV